MFEHPHNKALHPTAYAPLVPRFTPAAGELGRCVARAYFCEIEYSFLQINGVVSVYSNCVVALSVAHIAGTN